MVSIDFNRLVLRGGLTLVAALMLTTAAFGQDQSDAGSGIATDPTDVASDAGTGDDGSNVAAGGDGNATGEPDPIAVDADVIPDPVIDNGGDIPVDGWTGDPVDGGSGDGSGDWVDDGSGDGTGDWVADGSGDGTGDGTGDWVDDGSGGGTGDGTGDWVDDGSGGGTDERADAGTGGDGAINEGEVVIYYMNGGPVPCAECEVAIADMSVEAYQMSAASPLVAANDAPAAKPRRSASRSVAASSMADCLALHPQLPWICEWQNGAGH